MFSFRTALIWIGIFAIGAAAGFAISERNSAEGDWQKALLKLEPPSVDREAEIPLPPLPPWTETITGPKGLAIKIEEYGELIDPVGAGEPHRALRLLAVRDGKEVLLKFPDSRWPVVSTSTFSFSPSGKYLTFYSYAYEDVRSFIIDTATGEVLLDKYFPKTLAFYDILWLSGEKSFIIVSNLNVIGGEGSYGIYRWDSSNPGTLTTLYRPKSNPEVFYQDLGNARLSADEKILTFGENADRDSRDYEIEHRYDLVANKLIK